MDIDEEDLIEIKNQYPEITELEAKIIYFRREGLPYGTIQLFLGNPSKKQIRQTLLKLEPELIDAKIKK